MSAEVSDARTGPSDAELIASVRTGDTEAYGELYARHADAARVVAREYAPRPADADDIVSDAFARMLTVLQAGKGPDLFFRAYLFTTIRHVAYRMREVGNRQRPVDDFAPLDRGVEFDDPAVAGFEQSVVRKAFQSLPERWQAALWYTEVEGMQPAEVAPLLGLSANGVAALTYRAREGLRQAYLQQHLTDPPTERCEDYADKLGAYTRGGLSKRENAKVESHLADCERCRALVLELADVNHGMRAFVAPLVLGGAGLTALMGALSEGVAVAGTSAAGLATGIPFAGAGGSGGGGAGALGHAGAGGQAGGTGGIAGSTGAAIAAVAASTLLVAGVGFGLWYVASNPGEGPAPVAVATTEPSESSDPDPSPAPTPAPSPAPSPSPVDPSDPATVPDDTDDTDDTTGPNIEPDSGTDQISAQPQSPGTDTNPAPGPTTIPTPPAPTPPPETTPPPVTNPHLVLSQVAAGQLVAGRDGVIALQAGNSGDGAASDLVIRMTLPAGMSATGRSASVSDDGGWLCGSGVEVVCTRPALAPGATSSAYVTVSVDGKLLGEQSIAVSLSGQGSESANATFSSTVVTSGLAARFFANGHYSVTESGAPLMSCPTTEIPVGSGPSGGTVDECLEALAGQSTGARTRFLDNNYWNMVPIPPGDLAVSATTRVDVPAGAKVVYAGLYWTASHTNGAFGTATLVGPGGGSQTVSDRNALGDGDARQAFADVTDLVASYGGGNWSLTDVRGLPNFDYGGFGGFSLVVVYADPAANQQVVVQDGLRAVDRDDSVDFPLVGQVGGSARIGLVTWEGDRTILGDKVLIGGVAATPDPWYGPNGAVWTSDPNNVFDSTAHGYAGPNTMGTDVKSFSNVTVGAANQVSVSTDGDVYYVGVITQTAPMPTARP